MPCPIEEIDAVVLSHAHLDHAGRLPFLTSRGYARTIHATKATADLTAIMLADSARIQENDYDFLIRHKRAVEAPLYGVRDAERVQELIRRHGYDEWFDVCPGLRARYTDAGHILGSASVVLEATEESKGRVLIPAFAVGRAQELVYDLHVLSRDGLIPRVPIVIDSPLASAATQVFERNTDLLDQTEAPVRDIPRLFRFDLLSYTSTVAESKALNTRVGPLIIIAGSGMVEGGRILHHLRAGASNSRNTVLIVGFQAEHTLGRRIVEKQPVIRVLGEEVELRAQVEILNGYSAHADRTQLASWLGAVRSTSPARSSSAWYTAKRLHKQRCQVGSPLNITTSRAQSAATGSPSEAASPFPPSANRLRLRRRVLQ